jgi:hypothetical protein
MKKLPKPFFQNKTITHGQKLTQFGHPVCGFQLLRYPTPGVYSAETFRRKIDTIRLLDVGFLCSSQQEKIRRKTLKRRNHFPFFKLRPTYLLPGPNPTTWIYNATSSLARFEN